MKSRPFAALLFALFAFRFWYGCAKFGHDDALQVYLIGLKSYLLWAFPFWGADVVYSQTQIPGGLQGLLVGAPFAVWESAFSPFVLLNMLSFACLVFFAWYLARRFPEIPVWFIAIWLLTSPWSLHYSAHIENPSYVLPMACLCLIAVLELSPLYADKILEPNGLYFVLGFSLAWTMQLHLSFPLLIPGLMYVFATHFRRAKNRWALAARFLAGAAIPALALLPTLLKFGAGGAGANAVFNLENMKNLPLIAARLLSFGTYEVARFWGNSTEARLAFLAEHRWAAPFAVFAGLVGLGQFCLLARSFWVKNARPEWPLARRIALVAMSSVCAALWFSVSPPYSHVFLLMFPLVMWFSMYAYLEFAVRRWFAPLAAALLVSGLIFQTALAMENHARTGIGRYLPRIERCFAMRDYTFLGLRRESIFEKKQRENLWKMSKTTDDGLLFATDFEAREMWSKAQNIVLARETERGWCCKMDTVMRFSTGLVLPLDSLGGARTVHVQFEANSVEACALAFVLEGKTAGKQAFWTSKNLALRAAEGWERCTFSMPVPAAPAGATELSCYLWLLAPSCGGAVYIDDATLRFSSK